MVFLLILPFLIEKINRKENSLRFVRLNRNIGAGRGIRTPVGFHPNGFQDRLVMTASIFLHHIQLLIYYTPCQSKSQPLFLIP